MAENVVVSISVQDLGSATVRKFATATKTALTGVAGSVNTVGTAFKGFSGQLALNTANAFKVLPAYAAVGAAIGGVGALVATAARDFIAFDKGLREASSIAPELARNFEATRQAIIALPASLGKTAEIADGLFETLSAGISIGKSMAESLEFTAGAAKLARAALTDNATAVKALSTTMSAFGADIQDVQRFSDAFQKSVVIGQFRFEELAGTIGRVSPVAATLGVSIEETTGALATLSQGGLSAGEAVTALRSAFSNMIQQADEFRAVGIDVNSILSEKDGLVKLFTRLREVTGGNVEAIRKFIPDVRGLVAALALTGPQYESLIKNNEIMANALGETEKAFEQNQKSISAALDRLAAEFDRAVQRMADSEGAGRLVSIIDGIGKALNDVSQPTGNFRNAMDQVGATMLSVKSSFDLIGGAVVQLGSGTVKTVASFWEWVPVLGRVATLTKDAAQEVQFLGKGMQLTGEEAREFAEELRSGGLAAQEALNAVRKANADAAEARLKSIRAANAEVGVLKAVEEATILAAKATAGFGEGAEKAATGLQIMGLEALGAENKTDQLRERLVQVVEGTDQFENRLNAMTGALVKTKGLTGEAADDVRALALEYGRSIEALTQSETALRSWGATTDQLQGKTEFLVDTLVKNGEALGFTKQEVLGMIEAYQGQVAQSEKLGKQLRENDIDAKKFATTVSQVRIEITAATTEATKMEAAFKGLTGISLQSLATQTEQVLTFVNQLSKDAATQTEFLVEILEKEVEAYRKLGREAPDALRKTLEETKKVERANRTAEESFERLNGIRFDDLTDSIQDMQKDIENLGGSFLLQGTKMAEAVTDLSNEAKRLFANDIPDSIRKTLDSLATMARATTTVRDAFAEINGIGLDELKRNIKQDITEVGLLFNAGLLGGDRLKAVLAGIREEILKLPQATQDALIPFIETLEAGVASSRTLKESIELLGAKPLKDLKDRANEVTIAFKQALEGGTVSGQELVRVFKEQVVPAYEAAGMRIPASLLRAFELAERRGRLEAARVGGNIGIEFGEKLGEGMEGAVLNSVGQVISTIEGRFSQVAETISQRFDRIAPGTTKPIPGVRFAGEGDLEGLKQNERDLKERIANIRGATGAARSSREVLNRALTDIQNKIKALEGQSQSTRNALFDFGRGSTSSVREVNNEVTRLNDSFDNLAMTASRTGDIIRETTSISGSGFTVGTGTAVPTTSDDTSLTTGISGGQTGGGFRGAIGFGPNQQSLFGRFQSGVNFAAQGQRAILDRGEMVVPRDIAKRLRSLDARQIAGTGGGAISGAITSGASFRPGPRSFVPGVGFVGSIIIGRRRPGTSLAQSGFSNIPGFGVVPNQAISTAVGNLDQLGGENAQAQQQKQIVKLVRGSITRRDLTRDISGATALTEKGQPSTGGS